LGVFTSGRFWQTQPLVDTASNVQRFRGGLVFKAHILCVSLISRLESNKEEEEEDTASGRHGPWQAEYRGISLIRNRLPQDPTVGLCLV